MVLAQLHFHSIKATTKLEWIILKSRMQKLRAIEPLIGINVHLKNMFHPF
jgi:hypothetical protein